MNQFLRLTGSMPALLEEQLPMLLQGQQILGCQVLGADDDHLRIEVYLPQHDHAEADALSQRLQEAGVGDIVVDMLAGKDWLASYREQAQPFCVGRLWWIEPRPGQRSLPPAGRIPLVIEPRAAFGTGSHESTKLVLLELENLAVEGKKVLDVGTGSGILAFAAQQLRASATLALDIDHAAVWVAHSNCELQQLTDRPTLVVGTLDCVGHCHFDIVLCNMLAENLVPLLPRLARLLDGGGVLVLSGILQSDRIMVTREVEDSGLAVAAVRSLGEWISLRVGTHG